VNALWPHGDPDLVARAILAQPQFRDAARPSGERPWWAPLADLAAGLWQRLVDAVRHLGGGSRIAEIVGIVVLAAVLLFLAFVVARFVRFPARRPQRSSALDAAAIDRSGDAATLRAEALRAAAEGRPRDAAALLWSSLLRALDETGRVRFDAARTPGEWRRLVRDAAFDGFARDAVLALFGDRPVDDALVARMRDAYDRLVVR
jgi:hypothetical protein